MLKIFLTDLAAYNNGCLVGEWLELPLEKEELETSIKNILKQGGELCGGSNEEYFITDYEFENIQLFKIEEFDDPYELNQQIVFIEENVDPEQYDIIKVLLDNGFANSIDEAVHKIDTVIVHSESSMESIAEEYIDQIFNLDSLPPIIAGHIDYAGIGRDLEIDGNFIRENLDIYEIIE